MTKYEQAGGGRHRRGLDMKPVRYQPLNYLSNAQWRRRNSDLERTQLRRFNAIRFRHVHIFSLFVNLSQLSLTNVY